MTLLTLKSNDSSSLRANSASHLNDLNCQCHDCASLDSKLHYFQSEIDSLKQRFSSFEVVQEVLNPSVHEEAHQVENQDVEIYESTSVNGNHEASVESLEGEWNEVRNPSKPIQEVDSLIMGDSIIKDIKPSLMSASNTRF